MNKVTFVSVQRYEENKAECHSACLYVRENNTRLALGEPHRRDDLDYNSKKKRARIWRLKIQGEERPVQEPQGALATKGSLAKHRPSPPHHHHQHPHCDRKHMWHI